jgi:hypothetical protein
MAERVRFYESPEGKAHLEHSRFVGAAARRMELLTIYADPEPSIRIGVYAVNLVGLAALGIPPGWIENEHQRVLAELRELLGRPAHVDDLVAALRRCLVHPPPEWVVKVLAAALGEHENGRNPDRPAHLWQTVMQAVSSPSQSNATKRTRATPASTKSQTMYRTTPKGTRTKRARTTP